MLFTYRVREFIEAVGFACVMNVLPACASLPKAVDDPAGAVIEKIVEICRDDKDKAVTVAAKCLQDKEPVLERELKITCAEALLTVHGSMYPHEQQLASFDRTCKTRRTTTDFQMD